MVAQVYCAFVVSWLHAFRENGTQRLESNGEWQQRAHFPRHSGFSEYINVRDLAFIYRLWSEKTRDRDFKKEKLSWILILFSFVEQLDYTSLLFRKSCSHYKGTVYSVQNFCLTHGVPFSILLYGTFYCCNWFHFVLTWPTYQLLKSTVFNYVSGTNLGTDAPKTYYVCLRSRTWLFCEKGGPKLLIRRSWDIFCCKVWNEVSCPHTQKRTGLLKGCEERTGNMDGAFTPKTLSHQKLNSY